MRKTKRVLFAIGLVLAVPVTVQAGDRTIGLPQLIAGTLGSSVIDTALNFTNVNFANCDASVLLTSGGGQVLNESLQIQLDGESVGNEFFFTIPALGQKQASIQLEGALSSFAAHVRIQNCPDPDKIGVEAVYDTRQNGQIVETVPARSELPVLKNGCAVVPVNGLDIGISAFFADFVPESEDLTITFVPSEGFNSETAMLPIQDRVSMTVSELGLGVNLKGRLEVCRSTESPTVAPLYLIFGEFEAGPGGVQFKQKTYTQYNTGCFQNETTVCLHENRFRVEVDDNLTGSPVPVEGMTQDGSRGIFGFSPAEQLIVDLINACTVGNSFWVFAAATTPNIAFEMTVTDTFTDTVQTYGNPLGQDFTPIADTSAFATCP